MSFSTFSFPTRIVFGPGVVRELPGALRAAGSRRPLIVTDRGLVQAPIFKVLAQNLETEGLGAHVFCDISPNPIAPEVEAGGRRARELKADAIIAFGGGSALDAAKAVRLLATHDGPILDYDEARGGTDRIRPDLPYMVAIATTAGTGSEVGRSTVITDPAQHVKRIVFSPHLIASLVLADPELTVGLPPHLTAATGMDALTHCVESYLATGYHPMCDAIALGGVELVARHLRQAVRRGDDLDARGGMLMAAMMGAVAFQKGLGVTHSLAHPLTTVAGVHHGQANGIMLARAMAFNSAACPERLAAVGQAMGLRTEGDGPARARAAIDALASLASDVGIPARLSQAGVQREMIEPMVAQAVQDGCHQTNPRPCRAEDFRLLYQEAF